MIVHILQILFTTWQVMILVNSVNTNHNRNQLRVFKKIFIVIYFCDILFISANFKESNDEIFNRAYNTPQDMQVHFARTMDVIILWG